MYPLGIDPSRGYTGIKGLEMILQTSPPSLKLQPLKHLASLSISPPSSQNKTEQNPPWVLIKKQVCFY